MGTFVRKNAYMRMSDNGELRKVFLTKEFLEFYESLSIQIQHKFDYVVSIVKTERVISAKFVKHLENTDFYEMRVAVGNNEYRTVLFTMDNRDVMLATRIILLNAFVKKSTKDYRKQIEKAQKILGGLTYDED
ncbi:type II toxin-antitoxin system RelE/ParE family toxin [uncultured Bacteroides sp.]|uniref:type II toxin-antitoxin system RelE/ParE family toxin n=1 Tax=uncultured Bacteroides sp. TaxID=162156 RepID=UPI00344D90CE